MTRLERIVILATVGGAILFGSTNRTGAGQEVSVLNEQAIRQIVQEEVTRQLRENIPTAVQAEVKRQWVREAVRTFTQNEVDRQIQGTNSLLVTIRSQIMLYALQHRDHRPTLAQFKDGWKVLTNVTDADGNIVPMIRDSRGNPGPSQNGYGPYLPAPMRNPFTLGSSVVEPSKATARDGWTYDEKTGFLRAVIPQEAKDKIAARDIEVVGTPKLDKAE